MRAIGDPSAAQVLRLRIAALLLALAACSSSASRAQEPAPPAAPAGPPATSAAELFALPAVPTLTLTLGRKSRAALIAHPRRYADAILGYGGKTYPVRIKLKGNRSFRKLVDKPALRLRFDGRGFLGLEHLVLNNLVDDPTGVRELLAYALYRTAGVPAPRVGLARLEIDGEPYGAYLMVEPIDPRFIAGSLGAGPSALFEGEYGCDVYPADADRIDRKAGGADAVAAFAHLAAIAAHDPHALFAPASSPLRLAEIVSFLAVNTAVGDFDGYFHSHNFFLAAVPFDGRFRLIPWGSDRVFHHHVPIYGSQGRLAARCFADHDCRVAYTRRLLEVARLMTGPTAVQALLDRTAALFASDGRAGVSAADRRAARDQLVAFVARRPAELRAEASCLAGDREVDRDGDGAGCMDCDDHDPAIHPGATETCDGKDDDCDGLVDEAPGCACQVVRADGAEFQLCDLPMPWAEARAHCAAKGLALARIDTPAQARAVFTAAMAIRSDRWWLGAQADSRGGFAWVDGAAPGRPMWDHGEPDDSRCEQHCLVVDEGAHGAWALGHCQLDFPFVCRAGAVDRGADLTPGGSR